MNFEVRIDPDGTMWYRLDELIKLFEDMENDKGDTKESAIYRNTGYFGGMTLKALKERCLKGDAKIAHMKSWPGEEDLQ